MALPHIKNSIAGRNNYDPLTTNLFRVTLIPPQGATTGPIVTEAVLNCTGFKRPGVEAIQQNFQTSKRNYASAEHDNTQNITVTFELNLNNQYQVEVLNHLLSWYDTVFDPLTGAMGRKVDYVGSIIIENYARNGQIFWTRTLLNAWPSGDLTGGPFDVDYTSPDPQQLPVVFIADDYEETRT